MKRINLYVSPEEYAQVRALGACWDKAAACWYLDTAADPQPFQRWLLAGDAGTAAEEPEAFIIQSDHAYVASAASTCCRCRREIEVVAIYCESGTASDEPLGQFTVQSLWAVGPELARQLDRWPAFRFDERQGCYANHCPRCGAPQDDAALHDEPDQPFFNIGQAPTLAVSLTPLQGTVQMSGDYSVEI